MKTSLHSLRQLPAHLRAGWRSAVAWGPARCARLCVSVVAGLVAAVALLVLLLAALVLLIPVAVVVVLSGGLAAGLWPLATTAPATESVV